MNFEIVKILNAFNLPEKWDGLAIDYFQTKEFLIHTEKYNPCKQRYYTLTHNGILKTGAIVYTLKLDLFTYLPISSRVKMKIAGVPCSVSSSGFVGSGEFSPKLIEHIKNKEKGMLLILNLDSNPLIENMVCGRTLPTVVITNRFQSWESYLNSLKANYRRRVLNLSRSFSEITVEKVTCDQFDGQMYKQYLDVLKRSKGKLETLSLEFFQNLLSNFNLTAYYYQKNLIGWYISATFKEKYYFFLGGIDYKMNKQFNTYFNILIGVLKEGIEKKASIIDLGQTAEIPKLRMGGKLVEKLLLGHHSNRLLRKFLKAGKGLLEYSANFNKTHVFKETI